MSKIKIGDSVPHFKLMNQSGKWIDIKSYIGNPMIIYFYPKDDTPGCTRGGCTFRDEYNHFSEANVHVFGISDDSVTSHKKFKLKYKLPFDLLSDENNTIRKTFGVPADLFGLIPGRVTYVIDKYGIVRHIFNDQLNSRKHIKESIRIIKSF